MRVSIRLKMLLIALLTSLVGVVLVGVIATFSTVRAFDDLLLNDARDNFIALVARYYEENGTLQGFDTFIASSDNPPQNNNQRPNAPNSQRGNPMNNRPPQAQNPAPFVLVDANGSLIVGDGEFNNRQRISQQQLERGEPVEVDGTRIGTILLTGQPAERNERDQQYISTIRSAVMIGSAGAAVMAVIVGVLGAQLILRPIRDLGQGIIALQTGNLEHQIPVRSNDELGDVAGAFNDMSAGLARANQLRRQMTADIAHDLRTPLSVIRGYLEGLRDGTLKPTQARFDTMFGEAQQLDRLIEDLRTLSLADAGELTLNRMPTNMHELLQSTANAFQAKANDAQITLEVHAEQFPQIAIDRDRIAQVLGNLVSNALRYTPPQGNITLSAKQLDRLLIIRVHDTGTGISASKLPHIFERFYRADSSRTSDTGESGLGLAIAKSIIEAHGGTIRAESLIGQGTAMIIQLPL